MSLVNSAPELSLLIPAHNAASWLGQTLDSISAQMASAPGDAHPGSSALPLIELLLLDDGSTDTTAQVMQSLAAGMPHVQVRSLHNPRALGVGAARNRLLDEAQGRWIWFIDADDRVRPGALRRLLSILQREPDLELVLIDHAILRESPRLKHRLRGEGHRRSALGRGGAVQGSQDLLLRTLPRAQWHPWGRVVRRAAWPADLRFPEGRVFEDLAVIPRLMSHCQRAWYCDEPLIDYRSSPTSILGSLDARRLEHWHLALMDLAAAGASAAFERHHPLAVQHAWWDHLAAQAVRLTRVALRRGVPRPRIQAWQDETARHAPKAMAAMQAWRLQVSRWPLAWQAASQQWPSQGRQTRPSIP